VWWDIHSCQAPWRKEELLKGSKGAGKKITLYEFPAGEIRRGLAGSIAWRTRFYDIEKKAGA